MFTHDYLFPRNDHIDFPARSGSDHSHPLTFYTCSHNYYYFKTIMSQKKEKHMNCWE